MWLATKVSVLVVCINLGRMLLLGSDRLNILNTMADNSLQDTGYGSTYRDLITQVATEEGINPQLALDIAHAESNFNPKAVGKAGEVGLFQIHPKYANWIARQVMGVSFSKQDLMDPQINTKVGVKYLALLQNDLAKKGINVTPALLIQTYNQGLGYTQKAKYQITNEMKKHPNKIYRGYLSGGR